MSAFKRWTAAALALTLTLALAASVSPVLAVPAAEPFADFRIDASDMDVPDRTLSIDLYRRSGDGSFLPAADTADSNSTLSCKVNQVTEDAAFYIQPKADGVRAMVDYLTDVNGDGLYELLDGGDNPAWDALDPLNNLVPGESTPLVSGQTYIMSAEMLSRRFEEASEARAQEWGLENSGQTFPLCRVTLRHTDEADGQEYEQLYYLEICGQILTPPDVPRDQWYYGAVEYSLVQGWFNGQEDGSFGPDGPLSRAQLAQVLWRVEGCPVLREVEDDQAAETPDFIDVLSIDWFSQAAAWCRQEGLITGYTDGTFLPNAPLTREQLASVLQRYAAYAGHGGPPLADALDQYSDTESVSSWAYDSMCWAVSNRLLPVFDNVLRPGDTVTRAELAFALYTFQTIGRQYAID